MDTNHLVGRHAGMPEALTRPARARQVFAARRLVLAAMALAAAPATSAADAEPMDTIVVEEAPYDGAAAGSRAVDAATLKRLRPATSDSASLLQGIAGLSLNGAGGVSSLPSVHGLADDRLRITVDGVDLVSSCPNHMNPPLSYIDPANVNMLTVFAGVSPVSVGGDSIGGSIIAESAAPAFAAEDAPRMVEAQLGSFYRSNNDAVGGNAMAGFATNAFSLRYTGSWSRAGNYTAASDFKTSGMTGRFDHTLPLDEVGSTAYETRNHTLDAAWKNAEDLWQARLGYQDMPEQLFPNQRMDLLGNEQWLANVSWSSDRAWGTLETRAWYETVDHHMDFGADKRFWYGSESAPPVAGDVGTPCSPIGFLTCATGMPMDSESEAAGIAIDAGIALADGDVLRVGTEFQRYRLDDTWPPSGSGMWPETFVNVNDGRRDRTAFFAEWETRPAAAWETLLGARYERVTMDAGEVQGYAPAPPSPGNQVPDAAAFNATDRYRTDDNVDLTVLARYAANDSLDVEFGLARKVRSPNLYERYTWSTWAMPAAMNNLVGDGNGYVGNVNLEPETAYTSSVTFNWHAPDGAWELSATPYLTRVADYIDAVALPGWMPERFNVLRFENQDARIYGIDLSAKAGMTSTIGELSAEAVVTWTESENRETGDALYNTMPLNARLSLGQVTEHWDNRLEVVLVDGKSGASGVRNEFETAGYGLVNLRLSRSWTLLRVDVGVENLLDRFYTLPTGGAYLGQGSTMMMSMTTWGVGVPGMGRSIYAGLTLTL